MTKEEAVEKIAELFYGTDNVILTEAKKEKLTAILAELMEPIGEEQIREWVALKTGNVITDCSENYYNGVIEGAKWAATRNLKVSLEGLKRYKFEFYITHIDNNIKVEYPDGSYVKFEDVEKLVE